MWREAWTLKPPLSSVVQVRYIPSNCNEVLRFSGSQVQTSLITEVMEMKFKSRQALT